MTQVTPLVAYLGGKQRIAPLLAQIIDNTPKASYIEVFGGMLSVFLALKKRDGIRFTVNDKNENIYAVYRSVRDNPDGLIHEIKNLCRAEAEFNYLKSLDPNQLSQVKRAARWIFLRSLSYQGETSTYYFSFDPRGHKSFDKIKIIDKIRKFSDVLDSCFLLKQDYQEVLKSCDVAYSKGRVFFFLDPPYCDVENNYGKGFFCKNDFYILAEMLKASKNKWLMTINPTSEIKQLFDFAYQEVIPARWSACGEGNQSQAELLIANFKFDHILNPAPVLI